MSNVTATLAKIKALKTKEPKAKKVPMTGTQLSQVKEALKLKNRGMNVFPNKYDISKPYRVSIMFDDKWYKYGEFSNVHAAAAVGTLISAAYFGEHARAGEFDEDKVVECPEFLAWLSNPKYKLEIQKANGEDVELPQMKKKKASFKGSEVEFDETDNYDPATDENPFLAA